MPKKCGLLINFERENKSVAYTYIHTISFLMKTLNRILLLKISYEILYVSLLIFY